jgi:hypothetical protein
LRLKRNRRERNRGICDRHRAGGDYVVPYKEPIPPVLFGLSSETGEKPRIAIISKIWQINCVLHDED